MEPAVFPDYERLLGRWVLGEIPSPATLAAICASVARPEIVCGLVHLDGGAPDVVGGDEMRHDRALFTRVYERARPNRAFATRGDSRWSDLVGDAPASFKWVANEPVAISGSANASIVVGGGGTDAHRDEVLATLPSVARACAVVLAREETYAEARSLTHTLKNLVAAATSNVDYVLELLNDKNDVVRLADETSEPRADALHALQNAREASDQMCVWLAELPKLGARR